MRRSLTIRLANLLNRDYAPWAEPYVRRIMSPLGALLWCGLASLACGLFVAPQALVLAAALGAIVLLGIIWPWVGLKGISCELHFQRERAIEGHRVAVTVVIRNRWPWPVWGLCIERGFFPVGSDENSAALALARVGAWTRSEFEWGFVPQCRGLYPQALPLISTEFPFGLWKATTPIAVPQQVVVWPRTFSLGDMMRPAGDRLCLTDASDHRVGHEGERLGARLFRTGDSPRNIHWILTARHDRLIVSERQGAAQSHAVITIDVDPAIHSGPEPDGTLEWAIRIGASVCESLLDISVPVRLRACGQELACTPGAAASRRLLDFLARIGSATVDQPPPKPVYSRRKAAPSFSVCVTTDHAGASRLSERSIVLSVDGFREPSRSPSKPAVPAWIYVPASHDVAAVIARVWEANNREAWRGC